MWIDVVTAHERFFMARNDDLVFREPFLSSRRATSEFFSINFYNPLKKRQPCPNNRRTGLPGCGLAAKVPGTRSPITQSLYADSP